MTLVPVPTLAFSNWISLLKDASTTFKPHKWGFMSRVHRKRDVLSLYCMVCPELSSANLEKPLLINIILEHSLHAKKWKINWIKMEGSHRHSKFGFLLKTRNFPIFYLNKTDISVFTAKSKQIPIFCTCCGQNCQRSMKRSKMIKNHEPYLNRILK